MASEGLYIAAMVALVNSVAREERWRCGGGVVYHAGNDAGQGRGCGGPPINQCGGADLVLSFGTDNALRIHTSTRQRCPHSPTRLSSH
jgi:hypothetical protein